MLSKKGWIILMVLVLGLTSYGLDITYKVKLPTWSNEDWVEVSAGPEPNSIKNTNVIGDDGFFELNFSERNAWFNIRFYEGSVSKESIWRTVPNPQDGTYYIDLSDNANFAFNDTDPDKFEIYDKAIRIGGNVSWEEVLHNKESSDYIQQDGGNVNLYLRAKKGNLSEANLRYWDGAENSVSGNIDRLEGDYEYWKFTIENYDSSKEYWYCFQLIVDDDIDKYGTKGMEEDATDLTKYNFNLELINYVTSIDVKPDNGSIDEDKGTLQMSTSVSPDDATNSNVSWSVENTTGKAQIDENGLLKALDDGEVKVKASAEDGSGVIGEEVITITNQIPVTVKINLDMTDYTESITNGIRFNGSKTDDMPISVEWRNGTENFQEGELSWTSDIILEDLDGDGIYSAEVKFLDYIGNILNKNKINTGNPGDGIGWETIENNRELRINGENQILDLKWNKYYRGAYMRIDSVSTDNNIYPEVNVKFTTKVEEGSSITQGAIKNLREIRDGETTESSVNSINTSITNSSITVEGGDVLTFTESGEGATSVRSIICVDTSRSMIDYGIAEEGGEHRRLRDTYTGLQQYMSHDIPEGSDYKFKLIEYNSDGIWDVTSAWSSPTEIANIADEKKKYAETFEKWESQYGPQPSEGATERSGEVLLKAISDVKDQTSEKVIMLFTDENIESGADLNNISSGIKDNNITLLGMVSIKLDGVEETYTDPYRDNDLKGRYPHWKDYGIHYYKLKEKLGGSGTDSPYFRMQEINNSGDTQMNIRNFMNEEIMEEIQKKWEYQTWEFSYNSSLPRDKTLRNVYFEIDSLEDATEDLARQYTAPAPDVLIELTNPDSDGGSFSSYNDTQYLVEGKIAIDNNSDGSPDPYTLQNGDNVNFKILESGVDPESEVLSSTLGSGDLTQDGNWYKFEVYVDKAKISSSTSSAFDIIATGNLNEETAEDRVNNITYDTIAPIIESVTFRNETLKEFWDEYFSKSESSTPNNYWSFGDSEIAYGKSEDNIKIDVILTEENLKSIKLEGLFNSGHPATSSLVTIDGLGIPSADSVSEGAITLKVIATDMAGNEGEKTMEVQLDNTPPLNFQLDGNDIEYDQKLMVRLTGVEDNTDGVGIRDVIFDGNHNEEYSDLENPDTTTKTSIFFASDPGETNEIELDISGKTAKVDLNNPGDGRYRYNGNEGLIVVDKAGNVKEYGGQVDRYVDTIAPRMEKLEAYKIEDSNGISELEGRVLNEDNNWVKLNDEIKIIAKNVAEWNIDKVDVNYSGLLNSETQSVITSGSISLIENNLEFFDENSDNDDSIKVTRINTPTPTSIGVSLELIDKAGNSNLKSIIVNIDNTKPSFSKFDIVPIESDEWDYDDDMWPNPTVVVDSEMDTITSSSDIDDFGEDIWYTSKSEVGVNANIDYGPSGELKYRLHGEENHPFNEKLNLGSYDEGLKNIELKAVDKAGNKYSKTKKIVLDNSINISMEKVKDLSNGNADILMKESGVVSLGDKICKINFSTIEELSGIFRYRVEISSGSHGASSIIEGNDFGLEKITKYASVNGVSEDLGSVEINAPNSDGYKGSRFKVKIKIWDSLGHKFETENEYVVKEKFNIKSTEKGGDRQIITEVDIDDKNGKIDLGIEGRTESGKDD